MEFRILGPVDVLDDAGVRVVVGGARERALLAVLLLSANRVVSTQRLVEDLWGAQRSDGAVHALRVHISRLRRALRTAGCDDVVLTRPHGYLLRVPAEAVDCVRFDALLAAGRRQAETKDHAGAAESFRQALAQWRGPALADVTDVPFARSQAARLDRLGAVEKRIDQDLACGRHSDLVSELAQLTASTPLREWLWGARMLALYRCGRQAEALAVYQDLRRLLHDELGLEPSPRLANLHRAVLGRHRQLEADELNWAGASGAYAPREKAKAPSTRYARNDGVNIAYQVWGQGPVDLVLVPGFVSNVDVYWDHPGWRQVLDRLTTFSRLIVWDKRGTGLSDPVHRVPTLDERVEDLLAVMDAAGSGRATLLGISEGGPMAALFAAAHPGRVNGLVLYGVSPRFSQAPDWPWGWTAEQVAVILAEIDAAWGDGALLGLFAPTQAADEGARRSWGRTQRAGASPAMGRAVMEAMVAIDCRDILPAVRVPTLVLHRRGDRVARVEGARHIAAQIPGSRLVEFPGADHLITLGPVQPLLDHVERFVTDGSFLRPIVDRLLATVLAVRVVSPTGAELAPGADVTAALHRELARHRGRALPGHREGLVATFTSPTRAARCTEAMRQTLAPLGLQLAAGLHCGECDVQAGTLSGPTVTLATRLALLAEPGAVLVTGTVRDLTEGTHLSFTPRQVAASPGLPGNWSLYVINHDRSPVP